MIFLIVDQSLRGFLCFWLPVSILVGLLIGQYKGRPVLGAVLGLLLGPIGWLLVAVMSNARPTCPFCKGYIVAKALKCKQCASTIPRCPACGRQAGLVRRAACEHCGEPLART